MALSGLCPHRFYPLGKSRLQGDEIIFGYHGISFNAKGQCINIPGQDNIPATCRLRKYPVVEHGLWIWVWPGDPARADPALLTDLEEIGHTAPGVAAVPFDMHEIRARYQLLNDNLLDLSHLAFLHATSIGVMSNATVPEELTEEPGVIRSRRHMKNCDAPPVVKETVGYEGKMDQTNGMDFYVPGLHAGFTNMCYPEGHAKAGQALRCVTVFHAVTPATRHSCYYHFAMASADPHQLERMQDYLKQTIAEDIDASESIEQLLTTAGVPGREVVKYSDRNTMRGHLLLQKMMEAEAGI